MTNDSFFTHDMPATRIIFGIGRKSELEIELDRLDIHRAVIVTGSHSMDACLDISESLGSRICGILPNAIMHVPLSIVEPALNRVKELRADGIVAIGGGSSIGLAKSIARRCKLQILAIPTTFSGSEMTPIWGETFNEEKITGRDPTTRSATVIYDPELTVSLPDAMCITSTFNALAHAIEALYAFDRSPLTDLMALEAVRLGITGLNKISAEQDEITSRALLMRMSWLSGSVLGSTTMSLHHKICHVLGGTIGLSHSETHTVVLPYVLAYNAVAIPEAYVRLEKAIGDGDPALNLWKLSRNLGAPTSLEEIGMTAVQISEVAEKIVKTGCQNPRPFDEDSLTAILFGALTGAPPNAESVI